MLKKSENYDVNYLATVVEIKELKPHPNADRLDLLEIFGGNVIVAKGQYKSGDLVVYFPIETKISGEFLHWANLFDKPEMNADTNVKGLFTGQQRVKPVKLRGVPSEGFVFSVKKLAEFFGVSEKVFKVGESFDMVGDKVLLEKWVSGAKKEQEPSKKNRLPKWVQTLPRPIRAFLGNRFYNKKDDGVASQIVKGQFHFHYSTPNFKKTSFMVSADDDITISSKWHGCVKHDTPIETLEYGWLPIRDIVDKRLVVHVRGYDTENDTVKWVKVDDYYFKANDGDWYEVELDNGKILTITGNNPVWMADLQCYRKVDNLKIGDNLLLENCT